MLFHYYSTIDYTSTINDFNTEKGVRCYEVVCKIGKRFSTCVDCVNQCDLTRSQVFAVACRRFHIPLLMAVFVSEGGKRDTTYLYIRIEDDAM